MKARASESLHCVVCAEKIPDTQAEAVLWKSLVSMFKRFYPLS